jgi:hypothetical protein
VPLRANVDMTTAVKSGSAVILSVAYSPLRAAEESEPVIATVDHAELRGLATTLLVSVRHLPRL